MHSSQLICLKCQKFFYWEVLQLSLKLSLNYKKPGFFIVRYLWAKHGKYAGGRWNLYIRVQFWVMSLLSFILHLWILILLKVWIGVQLECWLVLYRAAEMYKRDEIINKMLNFGKSIKATITLQIVFDKYLIIKVCSICIGYIF